MRLKCLALLTLVLTVPLYSQDWAGLQNTLIKFYRYQRSGLNSTSDNSTGNPYNPFYTATGSGTDAGKYPHWHDGGTTPLDGGWYDAGDFMKFGLPLGFSIYCLLKGYDVFPEATSYDDLNSWSAIGTKDNIPDILNEAKVGTDYLIKAVISSTQIVQTVGNGPTDHGAMTESGYGNSTRTYSSRPVSYCAGADVPGLYAAALALMSILYKPYDATYAATCLQKAQAAYTFASGKSTVCTEQSDPATGSPYYSSTTYKDKLACAAIELYRATGTASYLTAAKTYLAALVPNYDVMGYAHCEDLAAFELYRSGDSTSKNAALGLINADINLEISRVVKAGTPFVGGATVNTTNWGTARTVGNSAFTAALAYTLSGDMTLRNYALSQIQWIAGLSPYNRSWITQYGTNYPQNPHSRNDINLRPVRLTGGVVSGPTSDNCTGTDKSTCSWSFSDNNGVYKNTECALDYGCGAIGAVAFIRWTQKTTDTIRIDSALTAKPAGLDMASQSETITGTMTASAAWTVILKGQTSGAVKTYTGTGAKILIQNWKGDKDAGSSDFTIERVSVYLDTTKIKIWNVQRTSAASTYFDVKNIPAKAFGANDIEVDNFDDTATLTNLLGGKWNGFSDQSDGVAGGISNTPSMLTDSGRGQAKGGLYFILSRSAGATGPGGPYSGVRTTFNAQGTAVNIGSSVSDTILVDLKPLGTQDSIYVQLEQADIADKAYFGAKASFGAAVWTRLYLPIASFTQPAWKTTAKTLNLQNIAAVRFVDYGAGSNRFLIDNLRVSNLKISQAAVIGPARKVVHSANGLDFYKISSSSISYRLFFKGAEGKTLTAELFDCLGERVMRYTVRHYKTGAAVSVNGCALHTGVYFLKHTIADTHESVIVTFMVTK